MAMFDKITDLKKKKQQINKQRNKTLCQSDKDMSRHVFFWSYRSW